MPATNGNAALPPGLPQSDTILREDDFVPAQSLSRALTDPLTEQTQTVYRILLTDQMDGYDEPVPVEELTTRSLALAESPSDQFRGTSRKAAKISVANAPMEVFADLKDLISSLPAKRTMTGIRPKIATDAASDRVSQEKRNVQVNAFLYAASREDDNDYHLIIGRDRDAEPFQCMNVEISGLPPADSPFLAQLTTARNSFKDFFGNNLPGTSYSFFSPPFPVVVEGSLFFDMSHATGTPPGPRDLRPFIPTIWEIHPITNISFEL